jgi:hypothetical protein
MSVNDALQNISTIIQTEATSISAQGTGFFYSRLEPTEQEGPQWRKIEDMWVVTNRHVLLPWAYEREIPPTKVTFNLRKLDESKGLAWDPVAIEAEAIDSLVKFHADPSVDVAVINIAEILTSRITKDQRYLPPRFLSSDNFPGKNRIEVEAASDILVVGYPRGFYDRVNLFPIVKSGIIASRWGVPFEGKPYFLIDAKLFPGSSGSVVISKPTDFVLENGRLLTNTEKQFAFLGVYSGGPILKEQPVTISDLTVTHTSGFDLGIVWYADLVEQIIDHGIPLADALITTA